MLIGSNDLEITNKGTLRKHTPEMHINTIGKDINTQKGIL